MCLQYQKMTKSTCYKDFVRKRALWHRTLALADGDARMKAMKAIACGTWKRFEGTQTSGVPSDFITCDHDGWVTHHNSALDIPQDNVNASVQITYMKLTLYCFSTWRLVPSKSTDNRLVWASQYSKKSREKIRRNVPRVTIWIRVTPTPKCYVFEQHLLYNCFCCQNKRQTNSIQV